jgi:hypothetical protein
MRQRDVDTVVSNTSMKVANITETAITQGFT